MSATCQHIEGFKCAICTLPFPSATDCDQLRARIAFMDIEAGGRQNDIDELTARLAESLADVEDLTRKLKRSARSTGRYAVKCTKFREDRDRWRGIVAAQMCSRYDHEGTNPCNTCAARKEIADEQP